jgi:murein L,D-transpeptidase YcbB/YkuD
MKRVLLLVAAALIGGGAVLCAQDDTLVAASIRQRVKDRPTALGDFYLRRGFRPAWSNEQGPNRLADDLVGTLSRADLEGLEPEDYHLAAITALLDTVRADAASGRNTQPDRLAALDLLLTDAFLLYGSDLLSGRVDPETLHRPWEASRRGADLAAVLEGALESRKIARALQRLAPIQEGYRRLREALTRERAVAARGGWTALPDGPALKQGDHAPAVALLRTRLRLEGDLHEDEDGWAGDAESFDAALELAVRRFQRRHGFEDDGVVAAATRAELNVSAETRVQQLILNLERWRWLPQDLGRRYILVNIAAYGLEVVEDDAVVLAMRVVVGRRYRRTPVFSDTVRYIVLNPYWHVPQKIAVEDLLPKIQTDPSYLQRFGMRLIEGSAPGNQEVDPTTVDWSTQTPETFKYQIHQEPGRLNALGRIKFMFPNQYDVYLHDTPSRELFQEAQRDFSSGCIRIEKPIDLAVYLLQKNGRWDREALEQALGEGGERTVYLARRIPIHLLYWTAWADDDGTIEFRPDINDMDRPLAEALKRN